MNINEEVLEVVRQVESEVVDPFDPIRGRDRDQGVDQDQGIGLIEVVEEVGCRQRAEIGVRKVGDHLDLHIDVLHLLGGRETMIR